MLTDQERENVMKASQTANLLVQDLQAMVKSDNLLLSDLALDLLEVVVRVEQRLKRTSSPTRKGKRVP
jgi:hypothetical protein